MQSRPWSTSSIDPRDGQHGDPADPNGLILETVGDPDFVSRADRVALMAGASWDENLRGTNAIGTALAEESPVTVLGAEHFLEHNGFPQFVAPARGGRCRGRHQGHAGKNGRHATITEPEFTSFSALV